MDTMDGGVPLPREDKRVLTLFQQTLHLLLVEPEDKLVPDLDDGSPDMPGLCNNHISRLFIGSEIDLFEFHIPGLKELLDLMAVMASRRW